MHRKKIECSLGGSFLSLARRYAQPSQYPTRQGETRVETHSRLEERNPSNVSGGDARALHDLKKISIAIPVYNEERNIREAYSAVRRVVDSMAGKYDYEIIFTD